MGQNWGEWSHGRRSRGRWLVPPLLCTLLICTAMIGDAVAHGGAYQPPPQPRRGPSGPTTGDGSTRGPVTPSGPSGSGSSGSGPSAPDSPSGAPSGDGSGADSGPGVTPTGNPGATSSDGPAPPTSVRGKTGLRVVDFNSVDWARWWFANRALLLDWDARVATRPRGPVTGAPTGGAPLPDPLWRATAQAALQQALANGNHSIASAAAIALGKSGDPAESEGLLRALQDLKQPASVREAAALGLGLLPPDTDGGGRHATRALRDVALRDGETDRLRAMCVYALGLRGDQASLPFLVEMADAGGASWDVPAAGVAALGLAGNEMLLPDLVELLEGPRRRRNRESVRRAYAAQALANLGDIRAVPALREAALGRDEHVRRAAVLALGSVSEADDEKTTNVLLHLLHNSRDVATRCVAALSLGRAGSPRAGNALLGAYRKGSRRVRPFAAIGLGLLARHDGLEDATSFLLDDLAHRKSPQLVASLCVAVGLAREKRAVRALSAIASEKGTAALRAHAAFSLGLIGETENTAPLLRQILADTREPELQRECAFALGLLGDREALRILNDLVGHGGSAYVQGSAAVAIGRIGGRESADSLIGLLTDDEGPTMGRAMAAVGLGLMLDRSEGRRMARVAADLNWWLFTPTVLEILSIH